MKRNKIILAMLTLGIIIVVLIFSGCGGGGNPVIPPPPDELTETVIPDTTKIADKETESRLTSVSSDQNVITFTKSTPQLEELQEGDILFIGVTDQTPYGLLRKVINITKSSRAGSEVVVETEFASIEEAVEEAHIRIDKEFTQSDVDYGKLRLPPGVSMSQDRDSLEYKHTFYLDEFSPIYEGNPTTTIDDVTIDGEISINYRMIFNLDVDPPHHLSWVEFRNIVESYTDINVTVGGSMTLDDLLNPNPIHLFSAPLTPILIPPLTIVPILNINLGLEGEIDAELTVGVTITQQGEKDRLEAGFEYYEGDYNELKNSPVFRFTAKVPEIDLGGRIKPYIGPQLELMVCGVAGPHCNLYGNLELIADINDNPWWTLYGGFEASVGAELKIFSKTLAKTKDWVIFDPPPKTIAQADGPFGGSDIPDISGNWSGNYSTNLISGYINFVNITQSGINFSGTYNDSLGTIGTINGEYNGNGFDGFDFTMTQTNSTCSGSFNGTAYVNGNTLTFTFTGYNCLGTHENGTGTLTR